MIPSITKPIRLKLSLFWKFTIAIAAIVIIFGSINSFLIYRNIESALQHEIQKRGFFIAKSLSNQITSLVLFEDYVTIQNIINNVSAIDSSIRYIFITDQNQNLIVHTFESEFPPQLLKLNAVNPDGSGHYQVIKLNENDQLILDIAVPIFDNHLGSIRIGITEDNIQKEVNQTVQVFWVMVWLFLFTGVLAAFLFSHFITAPIKVISKESATLDLSRIGIEDPDEIRIRYKRKRLNSLLAVEDEIDVLASRFNDMVYRLSLAYKELQETHNHLIQSEKLATIGTLTAGLTHEINNPLAGVKNCIRRLKQNPDNKEQNLKYLNLMETATEKIEAVVSNLLNFSRTPSTEFTLVSISEILENSLLLVGHRLEQTRVSITNSTIPQLPLISGKKIELEQVFVNLLINALDSIQDNSIRFPDSERRIAINSEVSEDSILISISDTGLGISQELKTKVFEPFFTTKPAGAGTGLGLSIVSKIITDHNGNISFTEIVNYSTTVTVELPLAK